MKTTIEIPDPLFRRAKSFAAEHGQSLKELFTEALQQKLGASAASGADPEWMQGFGALSTLRRETTRIQTRISETFDVVEPEDRA